jgi:hypothetical protein
MKVDFLIIGAQKGGSTWLYDNLRTHPEIYTPAEELHFFSDDSNYRKGEDWYHSKFDVKEQHRLIGEKTPEYLTVIPTSNKRTSTEAHHRIHRYNPDMKLIVVLREPVARIKSAVTHMIRTQEVSPFVTLGDVVHGKAKNEGASFSIIQNGLYYDNLVAYLKVFKREQLKILFFETDIVEKPLETLKDVCEFLGVDFDVKFFPKWQRKSNEYKMSEPALVLNHYLPWMRFANNRLNHFFPAQKLKCEDDVIALLKKIYQKPNLRMQELTGYIPANWIYQ